jgi:uncharacterized membrane protein YqaE (UPF0057 family)
MKRLILSFLVIIIIAMAVAVGMLFSGCSNQYNLTLIKRNNASAEGIVRDKSMLPVNAVSINQFKNLMGQNDVEIVRKHVPLPDITIPASVENTPSIAKEIKDIDKGIIRNEENVSYNYKELNVIPKDQTATTHGDNKQDFFLYIILAIFLPPVCVGLWEGGFTTDFWISLILTLLFWIPGVIFALYIILR